MKNLRILLFFTFLSNLPATLFSQVLVENEGFKNKSKYYLFQIIHYRLSVTDSL